MSRDSREREEDTSIWGKKSDGDALRNIINKLSDERNLKDLHLKHYQMSTAQLKKRTIHLDIPGRNYDLCQHVVKTCPFCNSIKPISRERTSCRRIWRPHLSRSWVTKDWRQNLRMSDYFWMEPRHIWQPIHAKVLLHRKLFVSFMSGWTPPKWIQKQFLQIWLSKILMTCRHSTECTTWR